MRCPATARTAEIQQQLQSFIPNLSGLAPVHRQHLCVHLHLARSEDIAVLFCACCPEVRFADSSIRGCTTHNPREQAHALLCVRAFLNPMTRDMLLCLSQARLLRVCHLYWLRVPCDLHAIALHLLSWPWLLPDLTQRTLPPLYTSSDFRQRCPLLKALITGCSWSQA